jgi:hypothetical protein
MLRKNGDRNGLKLGSSISQPLNGPIISVTDDEDDDE